MPWRASGIGALVEPREATRDRRGEPVGRRFLVRDRLEETMDLRIDAMPGSRAEPEGTRSCLLTREAHAPRLTEGTALRMSLVQRSCGARGRVSDNGVGETKGQRRRRQAVSAKERDRVDGHLA